jgi:sodium-dependent phosphate cotransporter
VKRARRKDTEYDGRWQRFSRDLLFPESYRINGYLTSFIITFLRQAEEDELMDTPEVEKDPKDIPSRKNRLTQSAHIGDVDFFEENVEEIGDATWGEVFQTCCCHTPVEWGYIFIGFLFLLFFLYFFLFSLELLGTAAKVIGGCTAGALLGDETNPVAALMIGILATALLQSSSTTTSITVSLTGSGIVGTQQAIYMVMGANIGTTITNTIVALGQMGDGHQLERAFAGATVHDMFNYMTVAILFPLEVITGYLYYLTKAITKNVTLKDGETWSGPIKGIVAPLADKMIISNKDVVEDVAAGGSCADFYPVRCVDPGNPTKKTCQAGLIGCSKATNECPAFFQAEASQNDDQVSGGVCFFIAIVLLVICLIGLVTILQKMLLGMSTRIIYKATNINGYLAMAVGCGITILVQSSSITTSTLTPLVGMGVLHLEQMYPLTLGANIGTTITALLASLVSDSVESLQVALAHLFFNVTGIIIFYPIPFMRFPLPAARRLGKATRLWRGFPLVYIIVMFFLLPLTLLGISALFEQGSVGFTTLGSVVVFLLGIFIIWFVYYWNRKGGRENCIACMDKRERKSQAMKSLAEDMAYLKNKIAALSEHTGLPDEEEEEQGDEEEEEQGDEEEGKKLVDDDEEEDVHHEEMAA